MRNLSTKTLIWSIAHACVLVLGLASLGVVSAKNNKVDICHFQEENDSWKFISVGQPAAGAHLENHDDALPGGTTSLTGTVLDAECEPVEVTCPCGDAISLLNTYNSLEFDGPQRINTGIDEEFVFYNARDTTDAVPHNPQFILNTNRIGAPLTPQCTYHVGDESGNILYRVSDLDLDADEEARCRADIIRVIEMSTNEQP